VGEERRTSEAVGYRCGIALRRVAPLFAAIKTVDSPTIHLALWWQGYAVLLTILVAIQAYSNGGVMVSWLLTFASVAGLVLNYGGIRLTGDGPELPVLIGLTIAGGMIAAVLIGTLGYGIGTAVRRVTE